MDVPSSSLSCQDFEQQKVGPSTEMVTHAVVRRVLSFVQEVIASQAGAKRAEARSKLYSLRERISIGEKSTIAFFSHVVGCSEQSIPAVIDCLCNRLDSVSSDSSVGFTKENSFSYRDLPDISPITARQLGHILGDSFLSGSGLEGGNSKEMVDLLVQMLKRFPNQTPSIHQCISLFESIIFPTDSESAGQIPLTRVAPLRRALQERLKALKPGGSFLIYGGWNGLPAHAIIYQVVQSEKNLEMVVYNTGDGTEEYHPSLVENGRKKIVPWVRLLDIERSAIFDETFLHALQNLYAYRMVFEQYTSQDLYQGLLGLLGGRWETSNSTFPRHWYMYPQQSGTCSWKSLLAVLQKNLSYNEYGLLCHFIEWRALVGFYQQHADSLHSKEKERTLLRLCAEKFARNSLAAHIQNHIDEESLNNAKRTVAEILQAVEIASEKDVAAQYTAIPEVCYARRGDCSFACTLERSPKDIPEEPVRPGAVSRSSRPPVRKKRRTEKDNEDDLLIAPHNISQTLSNCYKKSHFLVDQDPVQALYLLDQIVLSLPMPIVGDGFWAELTKREVVQCMKTLAQMAELSVQIHIKGHEIPQKNRLLTQGIALSLKAACIQWHLIVLSNAMPKASYYFPELDLSMPRFEKGGEPVGIISSEVRRQYEQVVEYIGKNMLEKGRLDCSHAVGDLTVSLKSGSSTTNWIRLLAPHLQRAPNFDKDPCCATAHALCDMTGKVVSREFSYWHRQMLSARLLAGLLQTPISLRKKKGSLFAFVSESSGLPGTWIVRGNIFVQDEYWYKRSVDRKNLSLRGVGQYVSSTRSDHLRRDMIGWSEGTVLSQHADVITKQTSSQIELDFLLQFTNETHNARPLYLAKLLNYLSKHVDRLNSVDMQNYFTDLFTAPFLLSESLLFFQEIANRYRETMIEGFSVAKQTGQIASACFYAGLLFQTQVAPYSSHGTAAENGLLHVAPRQGMKPLPSSQHSHPAPFAHPLKQDRAQLGFQEAESSSEDLLAKEDVCAKIRSLFPICQNERDRALVYRQLVASCVLPLDRASIQEIVSAHIFLTLYPIPKELRNGYDLYIEQFFKMAEAEIKTTVLSAEGNDILSAILLPFQQQGVAFSQHLWDTSSFPLCKNGRYSIDLYKGALFIDGQQLIPIPEEIKRFLTNQGVLITSNLCRLSHGGKVSILNDGALRLIEEEGSKTRIQIRMEEQWLEQVSRSEEKQDCPYLFRTTTHWVALDKTYWLFLDKRTMAVRAQGPFINGKVAVQSVEKGKEGLFLVDISPDYLGGSYAFLRGIADVHDIHVWRDSEGNHRCIELPQYDLDFRINSEDARAYCSQIGGFYLSKNQGIVDLHGFRNYLLLENSRGQKKVVIPVRPLEFLEEEVRVHPFSCVVTQEVREGVEKQPYVVYSISASSKLVPKTREEAFLLAYYFLGMKKYADSMRLIRAYGSNVGGFTDGELSIIGWISKVVNGVYGDCTPMALAVYLCIFSYVCKNDRAFKIQKRIGAVGSFYQKYLNVLEDIGRCRLTLDEERELLRGLRPYIHSSFGTSRLAHLSGQKMEPFTEAIKTPLRWDSDMRDISWRPAFGKTKGEQWFIFRPKKVFSEIFSHLYAQAKAKSGVSEKLKRKLVVGLCPESEKTSQHILLAVIKNPDIFPLPQELSQKIPEDLVHLAKSVTVVYPKPPQVCRVSYATQLQVSLTPRIALNSLESHSLPPILTRERFSEVFSERSQETVLSVSKQKEFISSIRSCADNESACFDFCETIIRGNKRASREAKKYSLLPGVSFSQLREELVRQHAEQEADIFLQKGYIESVINSRPATVHELEALGTAQGSVTPLEECIFFFLHQDPKILIEKNATLTEKQINEVNQRIFVYLLSTTRQQQIERAIHRIDQINGLCTDDPHREEMVSLLAQEISAHRAYDPRVHPRYLVYEHCTKWMLRPKQVESLGLLMGSNSCVQQLLMGLGKSTVLLPLLSLLKANGENLSVVLLPKALFRQFSLELEQQSMLFSHQRINCITLTRDSDFSALAMQKLYEELERIRQERESLVITKKSISCLVLQFKVFLFEYIKQIADEVDLILHTRRDNRFALGKTRYIDQGRLECVGDIYSTLVEMFGDNELFMSAEHYTAHVKRPLAERLLTKQLQRIQNLFGMDLSGCYDHLLSYICGEVELIDQLEHGEIRHLLGLMKGELTLLLPLTLSKRCDTSYGFSHTGDYAFSIPYSANNTPMEGSEFGNIYEMLNYTMQALLNKKEIAERIRPFVQRLQKEIRDEVLISPLQRIEEFASWKRLHRFVGTTECSLFDDALYQKVAEILRRDRLLLVDFIRDVIFPHAYSFEEEVSVNPAGLVSLFKRFQGFTGIPWNSRAFPSQIEKTYLDKDAEGEAICLLARQLRAICLLNHEQGSSLLDDVCAHLEKDHRAFIDVGSLFRGYSNETVARLFLERLSEDVQGVAFYKDDQIVILERGNGIVPFNSSVIPPERRFTYYDQRYATGANVEQANKAVAIVSVGGDLLLRDLLQAIWRMRELKNGQRIDLLLSASAQKLIQARFPKQKISLESILLYTLFLQEKQIDEHCILAARQQVDQIPEDLLFDILTASGSLTKDFLLRSGVAQLIKLLPISTIDCPFDVYGRLDRVVSREDYTREIVDALKKRIENVLSTIAGHNCSEIIQLKLGRILDTLSLPERIQINAGSQDCTTEREQEREKEVNTDMAIDSQESIKQIFPQIAFTPPPPIASHDLFEHCPTRLEANVHLPVASVNTILERGGIVPVFDQGLIISSNVVPWRVVQPTPPVSYGLFGSFPQQVPGIAVTAGPIRGISGALHVNPSLEPRVFLKRPLFIKQQPPVQHLLVMGLPESVYVRILDFEEAAFFFRALGEGSPLNNQPVALYDIDVGLLRASGEGVQEMLDGIVFSYLKVQAKFFGGESAFFGQEIDHLKSWIGFVGAGPLYEVFKKIIQHHPQKQKEFESSPLKSVLLSAAASNKMQIEILA